MKRKGPRSWAAQNVIRKWKGTMMKQFMRALLCLGLLLPLGAKAEIFVFGDSLSDTGNAAAFRDLNVPFLPPFFPGPQPIGTVGLCNPVDIFILGRRCDDLFFLESRVSNGPVAVEILAKRLDFNELKPSLFFLPPVIRPFIGTNYAVAGATARKPDIGHLESQVLGFLVDHVFSAPPGELYVIMIGGNDVIDAAKAVADLLKGEELEPEDRPKAIIDAAVNAIGNNINLLVGAGARKFLVVNSPNIGSIPAIKIAAEEAGVPPVLLRGLATFVTIKFNRQLAARLDQIRAEQHELGNSGSRIEKFDLFVFFEGVRFLGKLFGVFENIEDACFDSERYQDFSMLMAERIFHPDCAPDEPGDKPKFDDFVFFDDIHPTGQVHRIVGKALSKAARKLIDD